MKLKISDPNRCNPSFETETVAIDGLDDSVHGHGEGGVHLAQEEDLKVHGDAGSLEDLLDGGDELGSDAVAGYERGRHSLLGRHLGKHEPKSEIYRDYPRSPSL
jgi:hypothetical protein